MVSLVELQEDARVKTYLEKANEFGGILGHIEHGARHAKVCADTGRALMAKLGYGGIDMELAAIAGFLHDIGWVVSKEDHGLASAMLAHETLNQLGSEPEQTAVVISAIGSHHGDDAKPVSTVSAALILADHADIHHSRVRRATEAEYGPEDNLHAATQSSSLVVDQRQRTITMELTVEDERYPVKSYFNLFLPRVGVMRTSAESLNSSFRLVVNKSRLL